MTLTFAIAGYAFTIRDYLLAASVVLNLVLGFLVYRKYYFNHTPWVAIRIKKPDKNLPEFKIKIKNTGVIPVEIEPPVVIFKKRKTKRFFQVRNGNTVFPLALFRKEEYDFIVDLARFYNTDSSLITYTEAFLEVRDKKQKKIARKRINIRF